MHIKLISLVFLTSSTAIYAQFSDTYRQAAQTYSNAAAQCQSPSGASCLRRNASYYSCLANQLQGGGSCGTQPSCSTACTSNSGGGNSVIGAAGAGLSQKQQLALTGLSLALTWISNHHHHHDQQIQSVDNEVVGGDSVAAEATATEDAAASAAQKAADDAAMQAAIAQANQASSELAMERAALTSGADPSTLGGITGQGDNDSTTALRNQLTADGDTGDAPPQQVASTDPSDQLAQLRAQMTAQVQTPQPDPATTPSQDQTNSAPAALSAVYPQNSAFAAATMQSTPGPSPSYATMADIQDEADVPNPSPSLNDQLQGLLTTAHNDVAAVKATLGTMMNTPTAQLLSAAYSGDAPAPVASDTPEQMEQKVEAQAVVGFAKFTSSAPPKALYDYSTANINQGMTQLGFAADSTGVNGQP